MYLKLKKYKSVLKLKKKLKLTDFDLITNYGLFSGDANLYKTLKIFSVIKTISNVKGDIIEFGIHRGNTSILIKKIIDIFKLKKKLILLDHFSGLIHYTKHDTTKSKKYYGKFKAKKNIIEQFIKFFNFKNIKILDRDATTLNQGFIKNKICLAYFDLDLFLPTLSALNAINKNISKNGLVVFDQGNKKLWSEKKAVKYFLSQNKNFKIIESNKFRQPDLIIKKLY